MLRLQCAAQTYGWGLPPEEGSEVASLAAAQGADVKDGTPYAELWMGTHASGASRVLLSGGGGGGGGGGSGGSGSGGGGESSHADNGHGNGNGKSNANGYNNESDTQANETLLAWLERNPTALGADQVRRLARDAGASSFDLPFLFKVLSVRTALSIQAHPDRPRAVALHAERPKVYKDANHKPEMAIALTRFEALSCFVPHEELASNFAEVPELAEIVGGEHVVAVQRASADEPGSKARMSALRGAFSALMLADTERVKPCVGKLVARIAALDLDLRSAADALVLRLHEQYPFDVGIFCAYFLNILTLEPGQGVSLEANEPHAYLGGQCVEVMATSDNVVRAGLTPKLRDTEVLCEMLTYKQGMPKILEGDVVDDYSRVYAPPFDEFEMHAITVGAGQTHRQSTDSVHASPSILLCLVGEGVTVKVIASTSDTSTDGTELHMEIAKGSVVFVVAGAQLEITATNSDAKLWRATCNSRIFSAHASSS